jgi:hypothetical protein
MKDDFLPLDDVADSMQAAASRLGIPIEAVKGAKRSGCCAFRGSRVHVGKLTKWLTSQQKELGASDVLLSDVLLSVVKEVARIVPNKLPHTDARFREDSRKLTEAIHNGFGVALCVVEPDSVDRFLKKSAALMENIFKSDRKRPASRSGNNGKRRLDTIL